MASPTLTTDLTAFIPNYWDAVLGENLYPNLYFYQFGTKRTIPRNFGNTIKIPRLDKSNIVTSIGEGVIVGTCQISDQTISGSLVQFAGAYKHSDILVFTALSDVIELSLRDIARDIAKRMDAHIRDTLSLTGYEVLGGRGTGEATSLKLSTGVKGMLTGKSIVRAVTVLDEQDNPRPPDNHYPAIIHPATAYDIQTNLSAGNWLDITKYQETGIGRTYLGEIGRMFGARFITSTNLRRFATSFAGSSGIRQYMFAPDAYYVTEISDLTARTYIKQLGSAGTADPVNQQATVGAKVYFGCLPATWSSTEYRMVRLKSVPSIGTTNINTTAAP